MKALAASGSLALVPTAAGNSVESWISAGKWTDQLGAGIGQDFADLGHADLGLAVRHRVRGRVGRREQLGLAFQLLGDAEALE